MFDFRDLAPWFEEGLCSKTLLIDGDKQQNDFSMEEFEENRRLLDLIFFPERGQSTAPAVKICNKCPVQRECLLYSLENNEIHGIWGGTSERTRRRTRRARRLFISAQLKADKAIKSVPVTLERHKEVSV